MKKSEMNLPEDERRGSYPAAIPNRWRSAMRRQRIEQAQMIMLALYGLAVWALASVCVVAGIVPVHPSIGAAIILGLSFAAIFAGRAWRDSWRAKWGNAPHRELL